MATRNKKIVEENIKETTVVKGSHLTVTTHPDGRTELEWDDEALLRDVRAATASVVSTPEKKTRKKKV
jgi:YD repeat-containing protein